MQILEISQNSAGASAEQFQRHLEGMEASLAKLRAAFEGLTQSLINSQLLIFFVDLGTAILNGTKYFKGWTLALLAAIPILLKFKTGIATLLLDVGGVAGVFKLLTASVIGFIPKMISATGVLLGLNTAAAATITTAQASNVVLGGLPIVLGLIVTGLIAFGNHLETADQKMQEAFDEAKVESNRLKSIEKIIEKIDELNKKQEKTAEDQEKLISLQKQLAEAVPEATTGYTEQGEAVAENLSLTKKLLEQDREVLRIKADALQQDLESRKVKAEIAKKELEESMRRREDIVTGKQIGRAHV